MALRGSPPLARRVPQKRKIRDLRPAAMLLRQALRVKGFASAARCGRGRVLPSGDISVAAPDPGSGRTYFLVVNSVSSPGAPGPATGSGPAAHPAAVSVPRPRDRRDPWLHIMPEEVMTPPPAGQPRHGSGEQLEVLAASTAGRGFPAKPEERQGNTSRSRPGQDTSRAGREACHG